MAVGNALSTLEVPRTLTLKTASKSSTGPDAVGKSFMIPAVDHDADLAVRALDLIERLHDIGRIGGVRLHRDGAARRRDLFDHRSGLSAA
jgi:hypothetical protein